MRSARRCNHPGTLSSEPSGTKASDYVAKLAALEKTAMTNKAGAWATSRPETRDPSVQETPEPTERPRWLDSLLSAAAGAALVATAWIFTMARRRRVAG